MPEFCTEVDVDPIEFVDACSKRERDRLIKYLVEEDHLPESVLTFKQEGDDKRGRAESDFIEKLDLLKEKFYFLSSEEEEYLNQIFKKYL
jgi:hypothetical protein